MNLLTSTIIALLSGYNSQSTLKWLQDGRLCSKSLDLLAALSAPNDLGGLQANLEHLACVLDTVETIGWRGPGTFLTRIKPSKEKRAQWTGLGPLRRSPSLVVVWEERQ